MKDKPPTANEITAELLIRLPKLFPDVRVWRSNRIDAMAIGRNGKQRRVSAGIDGQGDISGIAGGENGRGRRIEVEVKAGRDSLRPAQIAFERMITVAGGIYIIARNADEAIADLANILHA